MPIVRPYDSFAPRDLFFLSRTHRRITYHYIKKNKKEERNPIQHHTLTPRKKENPDLRKQSLRQEASQVRYTLGTCSPHKPQLIGSKS